MSIFGRHYRVSTFGESHCKGVGCVIDGFPPGVPLTEALIQPQLTRRRPGQSHLTTPRDEQDQVEIWSGVEKGLSLGTPICLLVRNQDQRPGDYSEINLAPRPSHADYAYLEKYGLKASSGGGRSSARETIGRVAAGAVAEQYLNLFGIEICAFVSQVGSISIKNETLNNLLTNINRQTVDHFLTRCPDQETHSEMEKEILKAKEKGDSVGGVVTCVIRNLPPGLGEPVFEKFPALLAQAMLSIPATKGFEFGSGFEGVKMNGSQHNDPFISDSTGRGLTTSKNDAGGTTGGLTIGPQVPVYFSVAFKPASTISQPIHTADYSGNPTVLASRGRHDPCVVPRAVVIVEAMSAMVVMELMMAQMQRAALCDWVPPNSEEGREGMFCHRGGKPASWWKSLKQQQ